RAADARAARGDDVADAAGGARHGRDRRSHVGPRHPVHLVLAPARRRLRRGRARAGRGARAGARGARSHRRRMTMAPQWIGVASLVAIALLVLLRVPVAIAMGTVGVIGYALVDDLPAALNRLGNTPFELAEGYSLSVVPLFLLMGAV